MNAFNALVRKDLVLYFSNRRALIVTLLAPILIAGFFGAVMGGAPRKLVKVPVAVVDLDGSALSKEIVASMKGDSTFDLLEADEASAIARVREGKVRVAVVFPKGFGEAAARAFIRPRAQKPQVAMHFDPSQSFALALVNGVLTEHAMRAVGRAAFDPGASGGTIASSREEVRASRGLDEGERRDLLSLFDSIERVQMRSASPAGSRGGGFGGFSKPFDVRQSEVTAAGTNRKYNGYSHSFAGMGVQFILFMGIELGVAVLYMRRLGLWKRLRAAPVSRGLLLGSRIASGTLIALLLLAAIYAAGIAVFGVRIDGSMLGFAGVAVAFALLASTFGLLIAAVGNSPEVARGFAIFATLILVMLGGAWVPAFIFPEWLQSATLVTPTRWAVDGLEAMTWRGLGLEAALVPIGVMLAFSALFAWIAVKRFRWEE